MEAMGFPRDQIDLAMRAAFFNPDRAVEYLLNGIPASAQQEQREQSATPAQAQAHGTAAAPSQTGTEAPAAEGDEPVNLFEQAAAAQGGGRGGGGAPGARGGAGAGGLSAALGGADAGAGGAAANLEFLRSNPQFQQLRQVVQQQPAMLEPILQQVAAGNPQLAQMITQHPEQFMQLLAEDGDDDMAAPPGGSIAVTEEERDAIERVCHLIYSLHRNVIYSTNLVPSYAVSVSSATWSFRPTLLATRTRSWPRISCSISLMSQRTVALSKTMTNPAFRGLNFELRTNEEMMMH